MKKNKLILLVAGCVLLSACSSINPGDKPFEPEGPDVPQYDPCLILMKPRGQKQPELQAMIIDIHISNLTNQITQRH